MTSCREAFQPWPGSLRRVPEDAPLRRQLIGGMVLHEGKVAEAQRRARPHGHSCPSTLRALAGQGATLVTVNDHLARRRRGWSRLYHWLGLSVGRSPRPQGRRPAGRPRL
ncbi:MAG: hypothetical protein IPL96_17695 [Holophagaceae bacterium]|nr:hypothetical protein [Holophagaceae bacterium]